jgi:hypothetical protein
MTKEMKNKEIEIKNAMNIMNSFKKFKTVNEAIATRDFLSDTIDRMKEEGKSTFAALNSVCHNFLRHGCATKEELRLKDIAENYIEKYNSVKRIYSTITSYTKNDYLPGYSKTDYEKEILNFVN